MLIPESGDGSSYFGWIDVAGHQLTFRVVGLEGKGSHVGDSHNGCALHRAQLKPSNTLGRLLRGSRKTVASVMRQSRTLEHFVRELEDIVRRLLATPGAAEATGLPDLALAAEAVRSALSSSSSSSSSSLSSFAPLSTSAFSPGFSSLSSTSISNSRSIATTTADSDGALFTHIADELASVGWINVVDVDNSFRRIELVCTDSTGRAHTIRVALPTDYPGSPPECFLSVPVPTGMTASTVELASAAHSNNDDGQQQQLLKPSFKAAWVDRDKCNLRGVLEEASVKLSAFVDFWAEMEDFDANTWVLEPACPSRSDMVRRIALRKHCSVEITLKPHRPRDVCTCNFIGPENISGPLRHAFHAGQRTWDTSVPVRMNLERILGQPFPSPSTSSKSDFSVECGVCYSYRIIPGAVGEDVGVDTQSVAAALLPDIPCESCGQQFHAQCIGEWLQALPSSRRSFNVIFGNCPYCTAPISVNLLES